MSAEFIQLISEANVPEEIATSLEGFDIALFARSCESADELGLFIQHAIASAGVTQLLQKMLAKASIRLLFSRCRAAESLPHLGVPMSTGVPLQPPPLMHRRHLPLLLHGKKRDQQSLAPRKRQNLDAALKKITRQSCLTLKFSPAPACWPSLPRWWQTTRSGGCRGAFA